MRAELFKPVKNERVFEKIARSIQREILVGNLAPGQKLPNESELAKQFSVGRSAVREALKVLELMGLLYVKRGHNGGTFVKPPDPVDAFASQAQLQVAQPGWAQLMEARQLVEVKTAELAALRATEGEKHGLRLDHERMKDLVARPARFIDADVAFHVRIAEAAKNEVFLQVVSSLKISLKHEINQLIAEPGSMEAILAEHETICRRIMEGDAEGAAREMQRHLSGIAERLAAGSQS